MGMPRPTSPVPTPATSLGYYDRLLVAIAASLGGGAAVGAVTGLRPRVGLLAGALVATVFVYLGLFRNPPLPETSSRAKAAAIVWHAFLALLAASL